jgi:hypothetical protein
LNNELKQKLRDAKKAYKRSKKAAEESAGFTDYDDGRYIAKLTDASIGESQSSGRLQTMWTWTFMEGEYENQTVRDFDGMDSEESMVWFRRKIARLGFEAPDDFDTIDELIKEIANANVVARIRLKTKGEFQNLMIDRVLAGSESEDDADEDEDEDENEDEDEDDIETEKDDVEDTDDEDEDEDEGDSEDDEEEDGEDEEEEVPEKPRKRAKRKKP